MSSDTAGKNIHEKRTSPRTDQLQRHRVEIKLVGEPIYQFKVTDVSPRGAGLLVNVNSGFLKIIKTGQVVEVDFISPQGQEPAGSYKAEIKHITETSDGQYRGIRRVGLQILEKLEDD
jgi:hypothetical protein